MISGSEPLVNIASVQIYTLYKLQGYDEVRVLIKCLGV